MFTIKAYKHNEFSCRVLSAKSLTILRLEDGSAEITLHQHSGHDDSRIDIGSDDVGRTAGSPDLYEKVIVENEFGKTTEIIQARPARSAVLNGEGKPWQPNA